MNHSLSSLILLVSTLSRYVINYWKTILIKHKKNVLSMTFGPIDAVDATELSWWDTLLLYVIARVRFIDSWARVEARHCPITANTAKAWEFRLPPPIMWSVPAFCSSESQLHTPVVFACLVLVTRVLTCVVCAPVPCVAPSGGWGCLMCFKVLVLSFANPCN